MTTSQSSRSRPKPAPRPCRSSLRRYSSRSRRALSPTGDGEIAAGSAAGSAVGDHACENRRSVGDGQRLGRAAERDLTRPGQGVDRGAARRLRNVENAVRVDGGRGRDRTRPGQRQRRAGSDGCRAGVLVGAGKGLRPSGDGHGAAEVAAERALLDAAVVDAAGEGRRTGADGQRLRAEADNAGAGQRRDLGAGRRLRNVEQAVCRDADEVAIEPVPARTSVAPASIVVAPV